MQGRYTPGNENSSSHSGEVTLQTSWFGHREKFRCCKLRLFEKIMRCDWSTVCFCVSKQNGFLTFCGFFFYFPCQCCSKPLVCSCFLRQFGEMLNFDITHPELVTCVACFYPLVHKFPTDMGAFQVLCANLFFGPLKFFTNKFTILGLNILNLHNLSAMFTSCPGICPRSSARLPTIFPAFLVREN